MEEKDLTRSLFDKTDALIARHRQAKPAVFPTPPEAVSSPDVFPVLTRKVSPEEAARLVAETQTGKSRHAVTEPALPPFCKADDTKAEKKTSTGEQELASSSSMASQGEAAALPSRGVATLRLESVTAADHASESAATSESRIMAGGASPTCSNVSENMPAISLQASAMADAIAPELADLVAELAREVAGTVIRQMTPRIRDIVEKRSRELIMEALEKAEMVPPQA